MFVYTSRRKYTERENQKHQLLMDSVMASAAYPSTKTKRQQTNKQKTLDAKTGKKHTFNLRCIKEK